MEFSIILANFIRCTLEDSFNNAIKASLSDLAIIFSVASIKFPLLDQLLQEVQIKQGFIHIQLSINLELISGAQWEGENNTIVIDSRRFDHNNLIDVIIFELCNAVNPYLQAIETHIKRINSAEQYAFLYEIAEHFSVQRFQSISVEMLEFTYKNTNELDEYTKERIEKSLRKIKKSQIKHHTFSMARWIKLTEKRNVKENEPHVRIYINQFLLNRYYDELLDDYTRKVITDIINNKFDQLKFNYYQKMVYQIYQDLNNILPMLTTSSKIHDILFDNIHLFSVFKILDEDNLERIKRELRSLLHSYNPKMIFFLEIINVLFYVIGQQQYENDFEAFNSRYEKILIKILFAILLESVGDSNSSENGDIYNAMLKYHSILQEIKHTDQQLAKKYKTSLYGYSLKFLKQEKEDLQQERNGNLDFSQNSIQILFNSYTYLKSFATQRNEALLNSKQNTKYDQKILSSLSLSIGWYSKPSITL